MKSRLSNFGKAFLLLLIVFRLTTPCISGENNDLEKAVARIMGEAFVKNNGIKMLKALADEIGPRLTGSEAYQRAADYCLGFFKSCGLTNVHLEPFDVQGWLPGPTSAEAMAPFAKTLRVDTLGLSINTPPAGLTAEVMDMGNGAQEDFKKAGMAVKGKIILAGLKDSGDPNGATREWEKIHNAASYGAAACLIISPTKGGVTRTRTSSYSGLGPIPAVAIAYEDGLWLRRRLEEGGKISIRLFIQNRIFDKAIANNVVAEIKGREKPDEVVILGAHLDSWFLGPGAADNALGASIVLETARILSLPELAPKRTIRFVLFSGEEQGTLGSFEYARVHEYELDHVILMMNLDMVGSLYPRVISPYGACSIGDAMREVLPVLAGLGITQVETRYPYDSDDFNFVARGVPAIGIYGNGARDMSWYHSWADTFDKIEIDKLNINVAAVATVVHFAASRPEAVGRRASRAEVIKFFKDKKVDKELKKEGLWRKLGFPDDETNPPAP